MAPHKKVESLGSLANNVITRSLTDICVRIGKTEGNESGSLGSGLVQLMEELPGVLLESLILSTITELVRDKDSRMRSSPVPGLSVALELLPRPNISQLDFGQLFTGVRLSRASNASCRAALVVSLARVTSLTKLVLSSKCTNDILETLGHHCPHLAELHISVSDLVTDAGLACLVPSVSRSYSASDREEGDQSWTRNTGCPHIAILDILKCWNVTPSGAKLLLTSLKKLKKLLYSNMKSVLESLVTETNETSRQQFPRIEYFDSSEFSLVTDLNMEACNIPESDPAKWYTGPVRLCQIPEIFPNITIIKMMLSDSEVASLTVIPHLVHLELEFSDDPGAGLTHLLDNHHNISNFSLLFLQVGNIQASHLLSIAANCIRLGFLRIIGFQIENSPMLKPCSNYFRALTQLHLSFYDDNSEDSDLEEEENTSRHTPEMIEFFLLSGCSDLQVINIHMNVHHFLNDRYLQTILSQNSLIKLTRLGLTSPKNLSINSGAVRLLLDTLQHLSSISVSKWKISQRELKLLRNEAKLNNLDVIFD